MARARTTHSRWLLASTVVCAVSLTLAWQSHLSQRRVDAELKRGEVERDQLKRVTFAVRARLDAVRQHEEDLKAKDAVTPPRSGTQNKRPLVELMDHDWSEVILAKHVLPWSEIVLERDPLLQASWAQNQRASAEVRYGNLTPIQNLSASDRNKFNALFAENEERLMDIRAIARAQGLTATDPAIAPLLKQSEDQFRRGQEWLLGRDGAQQLQEFDRTAAARDFVNSVGGSLGSEGIQLTAEQAAQLTQLLAEANADYRAGGTVSQISYTGPTGITLDGLMILRQNALSAFASADVLTKAKAMLAPVQYAKFEAKVISNESLIQLFNLMQDNSPQPMVGFRFQRR